MSGIYPPLRPPCCTLSGLRMCTIYCVGCRPMSNCLLGCLLWFMQPVLQQSPLPECESLHPAYFEKPYNVWSGRCGICCIMIYMLMLLHACIMLLYACIMLVICCCMLVLCCCMLVLCCCMLAYACSLFVTHTDIFSPLRRGV